MAITNNFHGTVRAIHQMAGRAECDAKSKRLSLTCTPDEYLRIAERSGNNSAYLAFCVRIAEQFIGDHGPITVEQVLDGEKAKFYARRIKQFLATLQDPQYFDEIRKNPESHRLLLGS